MFARRQILVTFIDVETGQPVGETATAPAELPETFQDYTTLKLGENTWEVVGAEPSDREEYIRTGALRLQIRKVEATTVPIDEIIFSRPTINPILPEFLDDSERPGKDILEIWEDDWRQIELVSTTHRASVKEGICEVETLIKESSTASGFFQKVHSRTGIPAPIAPETLTLTELLDEVVNSKVFDGLGFRNYSGLVNGGFALRSAAGVYLYGVQKDGWITTLCLLRGRTAVPPTADASSVAFVMEQNKLMLVDWCKRQVIEEAAAAEEYVASSVAFQVS